MQATSPAVIATDAASPGEVMMKASGDDAVHLDIDLDLDPVLTNFLNRTSTLSCVEEAGNDGDEDESDDFDEDDIYGEGGDDGGSPYSSSESSFPSSSLLDLGGIATASRGLCAWRSALTRGRLPIESDFDASSSITGDGDGDVVVVWPAEPLFSRICGAMADMGVPRFVLRHPETSSAVLLSLLRLTADFARRLREEGSSEDDYSSSEIREEEEEEDVEEYDGDEDFVAKMSPPHEGEIAELLAEKIVAGFVERWGGAVGGVTSLNDSLFVSDGHDLLDLGGDHANGGSGFGLDDGVWRHTGWTALREVQRRLSSMIELRELVGRLGCRPTAEGGERISGDSHYGGQRRVVDRDRSSIRP